MRALLRKDTWEPRAAIPRNGSSQRIQRRRRASRGSADGKIPRCLSEKRASCCYCDAIDQDPTRNVAGPTTCYGCLSLWILGPLSSRAFCGLLMQGELPLRVFLAPGAGIGSCQTVVSGWVLRLKLDCLFQRRYRLGIVLFRQQRCAEPKVGISKSYIELGRLSEML